MIELPMAEAKSGDRDRVDCCFSRGRVLLLTVTDACNQRCVHCMRAALPRRAEPLDLARLRPALADALREVRPDRVVISGGEPTLVPNLTELIAAIAALGVRPSLCTNATRIDAALAERLAAAGLPSATVGMEGVGADYEWFRGSSSYRRALDGVAALVAAGVRVTVNVTLHDRILDDASELATALRGRGLASVSVTSPIAQGRLTENADLFGRVTEERAEAFANTLEDGIDCPVSLRYPRCDRTTCPSGRSVFSMDRHGRLSDCPDVGATNVGDLAAADVML